MEDTINIKNLDILLQQFYNKKVTLTEYTTKRLTTAGENYGSLMLQVEIKLKEQEETLNVVAKMCPPNEWIKKMFNTLVTFKREIALYNTIFPTLRAFQKEQGATNIIDCIPECYGARISLNPESDVVDDDAVLLLENLKLSGFEVADRMKGFDFETAKLIIKDLAVFHAVPIALKLLKPDVFNEKILPHLKKQLEVFDKLSDATKKLFVDIIIENAKVNEECVPLLASVEKSFELCLSNTNSRAPPREPFATINHNDYWVNNTMIKFENNKPVKNKIVDFQLIDYGSPGNDIIFLLFSSVQKEVLDMHYDDLIELYYRTFINTLKDLKCDTAPFTFKMFQEELDYSAKSMQFFHIMIMLRPIFAIKGTVKDIDELSEEDMLNEEQLSDQYRRKVPEIILAFAKRGWL